MTTSTLSPRESFRQAVAEIATKAKEKLPDSVNGRIEKAVSLVLQGDVTLHDDGTATVFSATDPTRRYELGRAADGYCMCKDWEQAPQHLCKHRLGAMIALRVQQALPPEPEPTLAPVAPLPEAPASVNLKVVVAGHEVMVTLRDSSEEALMARLQAFLKRQDIRPIPPRPAPRKGGQR